MVVLFSLSIFEDVGGVASVFCGDLEEVEQPRGGIFHVVDVQVFVPAHVGDEKGLYLRERPIVGPLGCKVTRSVEGVGGGPAFDGFFAVVEDEPDGVALGRMKAKDIADFDQQSGGRSAVISSIELD